MTATRDFECKLGSYYIEKGDQSVPRYSINWTGWLKGSILAAATYTLPDSGLSILDSNFDDVRSYVLLDKNAGTVGQTYRLKCAVRSVDDREETLVFYVTVVDGNK